MHFTGGRWANDNYVNAVGLFVYYPETNLGYSSGIEGSLSSDSFILSIFLLIPDQINNEINSIKLLKLNHPNRSINLFLISYLKCRLDTAHQSVAMQSLQTQYLRPTDTKAIGGLDQQWSYSVTR